MRNRLAWHLRLQAGVIWNRFEHYAAMDYLQTTDFTARGPAVGMRLWF